MAKTWVVNVKWNGVSNTDEAARLMDISITRGRKKFLRGGEGFEPNAVGECVLTLRNTDGRYDPLNTGSAIYPNCAPGKLVTITLTDGSTYNMFAGYIYDIQPIGSAQSQRVKITVRDGWQWLKDRKVRYAATANVKTNTAVTNILSEADYPFTSSLDTGQHTIPYWWADNKDAMSALHEVSDAEFGILYINAAGALVFKNRSYRYKALTTGSTWTETDLNELSFAQPWDVVRNVVQIKAYPSEVIPNGATDNQYLWRSARVFKLRPGKTITLNVEYTFRGERVSAINVIQPVATTDYLLFANADGTGDNLTANFSVTLTDNGQDAKLVITNSGTRAGYFARLQVRGDVLNKADALVVEKDTSGGTTPRTFVLDSRWTQDVELAQVYADYLASYLDDVRGAPVLRSNRSTAKQCEDLYTEITLTISSKGINAKYRIAGVEHKWSAQSPNVLDSRLFLEPKDNTSYWTLGTSTFDSQTVLAF